jgi:tripartite-type tricarboxylate transporter receptor subunit TctC
MAPRGTPDSRRERISSEMITIADDPVVARRLGATGQVVYGSTPAAFATAIAEQRSRISAIIQRIGKPPE